MFANASVRVSSRGRVGGREGGSYGEGRKKRNH